MLKDFNDTILLRLLRRLLKSSLSPFECISGEEVGRLYMNETEKVMTKMGSRAQSASLLIH